MEKRAVKRSSKRTVAEMRKEMVDNDGVFLDWSEKIKTAKNPTGENKQAFDIICSKGFYVFDTGCITPNPYYSRKGKDGPARFRGDKTSLNLFHSVSSTKEAKNEDGWPMIGETTHLCHMNACMNPEHLIFEPRWKNWKRLYCFGCDCNVQPPCLAKFHPASWWENENNWPKKVGYSSTKKLKSLLPEGVKILPKDHFRKEDLKAENKLKRFKRKKKSEKQAKRKKRKL